MSPKFRKTRERGFTLIEVMVVLLSLVVILVAAGQLLFATRRASQQQQFQVEARQLARSAADYLAFQARGATDMNAQATPRNPLAVISWFWRPPNGGATSGPCPGTNGCLQSSYNNLTAVQVAAGFGDEGTDIITIAHADNSNQAPTKCWTGNANTSSTATWAFNQGCPDSLANLALFKQLTGAHPDPNNPAKIISDPLVVVGSDGTTSFYQITDYKDIPNAGNCGVVNYPGAGGSKCPIGGTCAVGEGCIQVVANPGLSNDLNPPGGQPQLDNPTLNLGVKFRSFRVCRGWLEQKSGIFDPTVDGDPATFACTGPKWDQYPWTPLLPNVEDLQVVYIFNSSYLIGAPPTSISTFNTATASLPTTNQVPVQSDINKDTTPYDATRVIGFRITVTGRSANEVPLQGKVLNVRPAAEDRPAGTTQDRYYHFQASATAMLRNRAPGS